MATLPTTWERIKNLDLAYQKAMERIERLEKMCDEQMDRLRLLETDLGPSEAQAPPAVDVEYRQPLPRDWSDRR